LVTLSATKAERTLLLGCFWFITHYRCRIVNILLLSVPPQPGRHSWLSGATETPLILSLPLIPTPFDATHRHIPEMGHHYDSWKTHIKLTIQKLLTNPFRLLIHPIPHSGGMRVCYRLVSSTLMPYSSAFSLNL
jgi:hypothetical protein